MKFLVIYDKIEADSFLGQSFSIEKYSKLRVSKLTVTETIVSLLPHLQDAKTFYSDKPLRNYQDVCEFFRSHQINLEDYHEHAAIYGYDAKYFPSDPKKLNNILAKAQHCQQAVIYSIKGLNKEKQLLSSFKITVGLALNKEKAHETIVTDDATHIRIDLNPYILNLGVSSNAVDLFFDNFQTRHFNKIESGKNYLLKTSANQSKMEAEYKFLKSVPTVVAPFYPQVGELLKEDKTTAYQVEKIYMFDGARSFINQSFSDEAKITGLLDRIQEYLDLCPVKKVSNDEFQSKMRKMFIDKNRVRLEMTKKLDIFPKLNLVCNFYGYKDIDQVSKILTVKIEDIITKKKDQELRFSHGDLCLSNILYSFTTRQMKLIDPRGISETGEEAYLPIYYDLAKLSHSFLGLYDLIAHDLMKTELVDGTDLQVTNDFPSDYLNRLAKCFKAFLEPQGFQLSEIRLLEASLFLSMIPLHRESNTRMVTQILQAMVLLKQSENNSSSTLRTL